jgi:hypothetical protein
VEALIVPVPVRIFQNHTFAQFARKNRIPLVAICKAARELSSGLIHANLGGGVFKQRIARAGEGKSGGFRSVLFFRENQRTFFILGFAKKDRANLTADEVDALKKFAKELLSYDDAQINLSLSKGAFTEIFCSDTL